MSAVPVARRRAAERQEPQADQAADQAASARVGLSLRPLHRRRAVIRSVGVMMAMHVARFPTRRSLPELLVIQVAKAVRPAVRSTLPFDFDRVGPNPHGGTGILVGPP